MLTIQKNDLFAAVEEAALDPELFKVDENSKNRGTTITLMALPLRFEARHSESSFNQWTYRHTIFAPGYPYARPSRPKNYPRLPDDRKKFIDSEIAGGWHPIGQWGRFEEVSQAFRDWLREYVKPSLAEAATRNLWTDVASGAITNFAHLPPGDSEPFSEQDQVQIRDAVTQFAALVEASFAPDSEQMREIDSRLNYLSGAVERLNQFDWKALAVSTVIGVGTTLSLDTQAGRQLWALFRQAMQMAGRLLGP